MKILDSIGHFNERIKNLIPKKYALILSIVFFLSGFTIFHLYVGTFKHIQDRPCSIHVWAQTARASIALNYYKGDMNFFKPKIHKFITSDGTTGIEFPLVNYIPAICYKLFGFNEGYYRGTVLTSIMIGLLFFFLMMNKLLANWFISFGLSLSAYCSPVFLYYGINFMPDVTSLAFALIAWHFFFKYFNSDEPKRKYLTWFYVAATLAALIKITSLVVILTVLCLIILDHFKFFKNYKNGTLFTNKLRLIVRLFICIGIVLSWYIYSAILVKVTGTDSFAMVTMEVNDWETAKEVWRVVKVFHKFEYYPFETYVLILAAISTIAMLFKLVNRFYLTTFLICTVGNICVAYFFFYQFKDHDYYVITLTTSIFLLYYCFADLLSKIESRFFPILGYIFIFILVFNLKESINYSKQIFLARYSKEFIPYFDDSKPYEDLEPKLRKMGIKRTDLTLCGFDIHWCASLYKMDQLGYTFTEGDSALVHDELMVMERFKYLILTDTVKFNKMYPNNLKNKIIGSHRGLLIYKLR